MPPVVNVVYNQPAKFAAIASGTGDEAGLAAAAHRRLMGFSVRESAGSAAAADANLRHGTGNSDPLIVAIELAANGAQTQWFGPGGIEAPGGVWVERVSGSCAITLYYADQKERSF